MNNPDWLVCGKIFSGNFWEIKNPISTVNVNMGQQYLVISHGNVGLPVDDYPRLET